MSKRLLHGKRLVTIGVCVPDEIRKTLRKTARKAKKTLSSYAAEVLSRHIETAQEVTD